MTTIAILHCDHIDNDRFICIADTRTSFGEVSGGAEFTPKQLVLHIPINFEKHTFWEVGFAWAGSLTVAHSVYAMTQAYFKNSIPKAGCSLSGRAIADVIRYFYTGQYHELSRPLGNQAKTSIAIFGYCAESRTPFIFNVGHISKDKPDEIMVHDCMINAGKERDRVCISALFAGTGAEGAWSEFQQEIENFPADLFLTSFVARFLRRGDDKKSSSTFQLMFLENGTAKFPTIAAPEHPTNGFSFFGIDAASIDHLERKNLVSDIFVVFSNEELFDKIKSNKKHIKSMYDVGVSFYYEIIHGLSALRAVQEDEARLEFSDPGLAKAKSVFTDRLLDGESGFQAQCIECGGKFVLFLEAECAGVVIDGIENVGIYCFYCSEKRNPNRSKPL